MSNALSVSADTGHNCARTNASRAKCWGDNAFGQLGNGSNVDRSTPVAVVGLTGVKAVTAGGSYSCAVLTDGTMRCWGANTDGQLGNGTTVASNVPSPVLG
jgi:alpha-tubulin suppressor-like RCC1 family protein